MRRKWASRSTPLSTQWKLVTHSHWTAPIGTFTWLTSLEFPHFRTPCPPHISVEDLPSPSNRVVSSWLQPAIFSGPPAPDDDSDDGTPTKSYGLVLALVITISVVITAAVLCFLYKRGLFARLVFSTQPSVDDPQRLIDENQGYSTIQ